MTSSSVCSRGISPIAMDIDDLSDEPQIKTAVGSVGESHGSATKASHSRLSRKRTKTGCLTCRKRRIKCGEERPTCGNCIKSKRQCEGYNQRVIFKDPLSTYRGHVSAAPTNPSFSVAPVAVTGAKSVPQYNLFQHLPHPPNPSVTSIAPRTVSIFQEQVSTDAAPLPRFLQHTGQSEGQAPKEVSPEGDSAHEATASNALRADSLLIGASEAHRLAQSHTTPNNGEKPVGPQTSYSLLNLLKTDYQPAEPPSSDQRHSAYSNGSNCASEPPLQESIYHSKIREAASALLTQSHKASKNWPLYIPQQSQQPAGKKSSLQPHTTLNATESEILPHRHSFPKHGPMAARFQVSKRSDEEGVEYTAQSHIFLDWAVQDQMALAVTGRQDGTAAYYSNNEGPRPVQRQSDYQQIRPTFENNDHIYRLDDYMDTEEYDNDPDADFGKVQYDHLKNNDLGIVVALQATQDRQDQSLRTYHSFLDGPNMLATYQPSSLNSPLSDSTTARIFVHYINVTGPSISLYERHPANPSLMFQGRPVPKSQQHIWAYTMPILALNNQALLHAMLAIGSLHMALLQDGSITASLKHYHIAIRQVAKSVALPMRRGQPATLAATMLLGWYELMSADHQKWSSHLLGARQLLTDIDFAGMSRYLKNRKLQQQQGRYSNLYHHEMALGIVDSGVQEQVQAGETMRHEDLNEDLVHMIMGKNLRYDQYGQVLEDDDSDFDQQKVYTQQELEIYETQRDLFWWYCKQDAFQSIISGNSLFMKYDLWSHCPPRAAIGRRDAAYGTYDHLFLLLGRLAEFAAKDLKRKRKVMRANGGQWRPAPGMMATPNSSGQNPSTQSGQPQIPSFAGMMPGTEGKTTLPRGFAPTREESPVSEDEERSLEDWTRDAEAEWHEIRAAFNIIEENYGPDFQHLGPEHSHPIQTPFGPALQYRTYSIAGIWIQHYMGLILCYRYHPSMPPAATVAAGIAARQTAFYANEIGRISATMAPNSSAVSQVSTGVGAGLIESMFGLFVAGVQYQDSVQRCWLVQRCFDTKRLTGWQTAEAIAMGCESSWVKAAEVGRGPPYDRVTEKKIDQKVWYTARRRSDQALSEKNDRSKLIVARTDRVHYALGLLGFEEDFANLDFEHDAKASED